MDVHMSRGCTLDMACTRPEGGPPTAREQRTGEPKAAVEERAHEARQEHLPRYSRDAAEMQVRCRGDAGEMRTRRGRSTVSCTHLRAHARARARAHARERMHTVHAHSTRDRRCDRLEHPLLPEAEARHERHAELHGEAHEALAVGQHQLRHLRANRTHAPGRNQHASSE